MSYSLCSATSILTYRNDDQVSEEAGIAVDLLIYARSLIDEYSDWEKGSLINPEVYPRDKNSEVEVANEIFLNAFNYILCHEFSHFELGHIERANTEVKLSIEERKENEIEADRRAIDLIISGITEGTGKTEAATKGITIAICSMLYAKETVGNKIHPDTDVRIIAALDQLGVDDNNELWSIACSALYLWKIMYQVEFCWADGGSMREIFTSTSRQLE